MFCFLLFPLHSCSTLAVVYIYTHVKSDEFPFHSLDQSQADETERKLFCWPRNKSASSLASQCTAARFRFPSQCKPNPSHLPRSVRVAKYGSTRKKRDLCGRSNWFAYERRSNFIYGISIPNPFVLVMDANFSFSSTQVHMVLVR